MKTPLAHRKIVGTAALLLLPLFASAQTYLVHDVFTDTDRINGNDGSAASTTSAPVIGTATSTNTQWVINDTNAAKLVASGAGMDWTLKAATNSMAIGYFPSFTLAAGTPVTVTLNFTTGTSGATTNNLRIALLDGSPSAFRTTDGFSSTDASYINDVGYGVFSAASTVGGGNTTNLGLKTFQRFTFTNDLLNASAGWGDNSTASVALASSTGSTGYFAASTAYQLQFLLSYDGSALSFTTTLTGGNFSGLSYTAVDSVSPSLTFNEIALRFGGGSAQFSDINFTGLAITTPSAVPEPSTYALIAGAAMLGFVALRRRIAAKAA